MAMGYGWNAKGGGGFGGGWIYQNEASERDDITMRVCIRNGRKWANVRAVTRTIADETASLVAVVWILFKQETFIKR